MVSKAYIPKRGDIVWVQLNQIKGHEQKGRRPALVLSPYEYNRATGLAMMCPITSSVKGYPFEVPVKTKSITGVVLTDQIRTMYWKAREVIYASRISKIKLDKVRSNISLLLTG